MNFKKYYPGARPNKLHYTVFYVYDAGKVIGSYLHDEQKKKETFLKQNPDAVVQKTFDSNAYSIDCSEYYAQAAVLRKLFWNDLADELGISVAHPKFEVFKNYLEERYSDFSEIAEQATDLVELL